MKIVSLGAGVQSSAMLLMALEGRFNDIPDMAIFADTGWEPRAVYAWLDLLTAEVAPFQIWRTANGNIRENAAPWAKRDGRRYLSIPAFLSSGGMGRRQCTKEFKLVPMQREFRKMGATHRNPIECWIGISKDEAIRQKPSRVKFVVNRFPLLEANLTREDCANYLKKRMGSVAPKSSCIGCPYHGDDYWARLRAESPEEFEDACQFDEEIRDGSGNRSQQFLHRSLVPLRSIQEFKHENQERMFFDGFGNECEGICGV